MSRKRPTRYDTVLYWTLLCSKCFGYEYAHHQEPATILLVWRVVYNSWLLVVGKSTKSNSIPHPGRIACCPAPEFSTTNNQELYTTRHTSSIVVGSSWWVYSCPKYVEQITSSIKHFVASTWSPSHLNLMCMIWGFHSLIEEYCSILGYDNVLIVNALPVLRKI